MINIEYAVKRREALRARSLKLNGKTFASKDVSTGFRMSPSEPFPSSYQVTGE